jgi:hypothetical protein
MITDTGMLDKKRTMLHRLGWMMNLIMQARINNCRKQTGLVPRSEQLGLGRRGLNGGGWSASLTPSQHPNLCERRPSPSRSTMQRITCCHKRQSSKSKQNPLLRRKPWPKVAFLDSSTRKQALTRLHLAIQPLKLMRRQLPLHVLLRLSSLWCLRQLHLPYLRRPLPMAAKPTPSI